LLLFDPPSPTLIYSLSLHDALPISYLPDAPLRLKYERIRGSTSLHFSVSQLLPGIWIPSEDRALTSVHQIYINPIPRIKPQRGRLSACSLSSSSSPFSSDPVQTV